MTTIRLDFSELGDHYRGLGKRLEKAAMRGALAGGLRGLAVVQRAVAKAPPASPNGAEGAVNTGFYRLSWKSEAIATGARIFNSAGYGAIIEHGRRAGSRMPPLSAIENWAMRRMGITRAEAKAIAYPIAKAIAKRGLQARKVMTNVIPEITAGFLEEVQKEIAKELLSGGAR